MPIQSLGDVFAGMIGASLSSLQRSGAFIEVAKRDIWSYERVAQERPDVSYKLIAIDFWTPETVGANLQRLAGMLSTGMTILHSLLSFDLMLSCCLVSCYALVLSTLQEMSDTALWLVLRLVSQQSDQFQYSKVKAPSDVTLNGTYFSCQHQVFSLASKYVHHLSFYSAKRMAKSGFVVSSYKSTLVT